MAWFKRAAHPEEQLSAYIDGELGARARRAVESHIATCDACSSLVGDLRQAKSMLQALPRVAPARPFVLGPEHARPARAQPRRTGFSLAPVAALTVLVALLFVDAANFSGSSTSEDARTAGAPAAEQAGKDAAATATDSFQAPQAAGAAAESSPSQSPVPAAAGPNPTPSAQTLERAADDRAGEEDGTTVAPDAIQEENSDGLSTIRILQIMAALAFAASLAAVYLPRFLRSKER